MILPDYDASLEFLQRWAPSGMWVLTSIDPERKGITTTTFVKGGEDKLRTWLEENGETRNIYFHVNPVMRPLTSKASREDVKDMAWLHVDVDPRAKEDLDEERDRILALLKAAEPAPTCIVFSGGGYQAFWKLREPFEINGNLEQYELAKRFNLQLEILYEGDSCHNVDRVMRLPGTINRPDAKKRKKGREEALAEVVQWNDVEYDLSDFTPAEVVQKAAQGFSANTVQVSGNVERFAEVDDIPGNLKAAVKVVIVQGYDPDNPNRWPSRSEPLFWACCEMVRAGCDDDVIYSVITDPGFGISVSVLDKGSGTEKYALHQIERAREEAIHPDLRKLNEKHAVIGDVGGKCRIISEVEDWIGDHRRTTISYQSATDFRMRYCNQFVEVPGPKNEPTTVQLGDWWLRHPRRRQYEATTFFPGGDIPGYYNLWRGFAFEARPGDCSLYLRHVLENICNSDEGIYEYLIKWMALTVQKPARPGYTAIVLAGRQGTGKGIFVNGFGALFGRHFLPVTDSKHITGTFNAHMRDCVVLFADEAVGGSDKHAESMLKTLITEELAAFTPKGVDMTTGRNSVHLLMASNANWAVPVGLDDRRFVVLDVTDSRMGDSEFFRAIRHQMRAGGYEALLHHLKTYDLSSFNVEDRPITAALLRHKQFSFTTEQEWWFNKLRHGEIFEGEGWGEFVLRTELTNDFTTHLKIWGSNARSNGTRLGMFVSSVFPKGFKTRCQLIGEKLVRPMDGGKPEMKNRPYAYKLPTLAVCREHFDEHFGGPYCWDAPIEIEAKEAETPY